jgi:methyl-accepting chemotaxis protein
VAAAIDEQSTAAIHITRSVQTSADNAARISAEMQSVERAAKAAAGSVNQVSDCTSELSTHAKELGQKVAAFFERVRMA